MATTKRSSSSRANNTRTSNNSTSNSMNNSTKTILTLAAGAIAGAVTALLLAPQAGTDTRRALRKTAQNLKDDLNNTLQQGLDKINSLRGGEEMDGEAAMGTTDTGRMQGGIATGTLGTPGPSTMGGTSGTTGSTGGLGTSGSTGNRGAF